MLLTLLLPKLYRADSALRSQAAGGVGACASVAPPAFGCRLAGWAECMIYSALVSFFWSLYSAGSQSQSQGLLFSEAKKTYAEAGQTGAQGLVRGCGPHCPPVPLKNPARDEASGAPRAGRGNRSRWITPRGGPGLKHRNHRGSGPAHGRVLSVNLVQWKNGAKELHARSSPTYLRVL